MSRLLITVALLLPHTYALGEVNETYLAELIARAKQLQLAERPEWRKLIHYVPDLISSGVHGLVDSPQFYNAVDGKNNPQSELEATLASFYSDTEESNERQNPQCLFIARYTWLKEQLSFDERRLPQRECKRYQVWHAALNPSGLTLIFASAYLNSPSSMYGHTLMRVDAKDQDDHTRLLAYAINFAANTNETNGLSFAINGLFGGYPGMFSILPYYVKVREYSNLENRDIWEYQLNFTSGETDRILMHAWELGSVYFQYFFFDENCSYQLLGLLQVARPELDFTSQFRWGVIPADTVRAVVTHHELVKKIVYRPSNSTKLHHSLSLLDEHERKLVKDLSTRRISINDPELTALPENRKSAVLESGQDYVSFRRTIGKNAVDDPAGLTRELLTARSNLGEIPQTPEALVPEVRPEQGHGSSRVTIGIGRQEKTNFQELQARATYHDIMDTDGGYTRGAEIEFFSLGLRHYDFGPTRIERFIPINILSLTPRNDFFQSLSWKIKTGWQRMRAANGTEPLALALDGGAGWAWSNEGNTALWYTLLDGSSRLNKNLSDGYALGVGATVGGLYDFTPRWRVHGYAHGLRYFIGQRDTPFTLGLAQRISLGNDLALRINVESSRELQRTYNNGSATMLFYF